MVGDLIIASGYKPKYMSSLEEIKQKIDIIDLVGEFVILKKAGVNFKGLCPFHNEKTSSFIVSREKQIWHCFGCGKGGDIFRFLMEKEGMDFGEAMRALAKRVGITLAREDRAISGERTKLLAILDVAAKFYHNELLKNIEASSARNYLQKRGLTAETVVKFMLGYAPANIDVLTNYLQAKKCQPSEMIAAGLVIHSTKNVGSANRREFFDRFRKRIMFPIHDTWGHVVGFTGRIMPEDEGKEDLGGKYMNTPTTAVYNKSNILYGLHLAKEPIKKAGKAVIVEGNMDVVSSHQANITNVVAASGTALTLNQVRLLKRFTNDIVLAFDADLAGENASMRGVEEVLREDMGIKIITMPEEFGKAVAKDPDELIRKSPSLWQETLDNALPLVEYVYRAATKDKDMTLVENKKNAANTLVKILSKIPNIIEQEFWVKEISKRLDLDEYTLKVEIRKNLKKVFALNNHDRPKGATRQRQLEERVLALVLFNPKLWPELAQASDTSIFASEDLKNLFKALSLCYNNYKFLDQDKAKEQLKTQGGDVELFDILFLLAQNDFAEMSIDDHGRELQNNIKDLKELNLKRTRQKLIEELRSAEKNKNDSLIGELSNRLNNLTVK